MQSKGVSSGHTVSAVIKPLALGRREGMCSKQFLQQRWKLNGFWQAMENGSLGFRHGSDCVLITSNCVLIWALEQSRHFSSLIRILVDVACLVTGRRLLVDLHRLHIPVGLRSGLLKCLRLSCIPLASLLPIGIWIFRKHPNSHGEVKLCNYIDAISITFRYDLHADKAWLLLLVRFTFAYFSILQFQSFKPKRS